MSMARFMPAVRQVWKAQKKYAEEFDVKNAYGSADEMLADKNIDIVYIATPHNSHYEF